MNFPTKVPFVPIGPVQRDSRFISASSLYGQAVPPREWAVEGWIPSNTVTLFSGDGGTGKSLASTQLAVAAVTGRAWLGLPTRPGPAIYLTAEDDLDELHRRLFEIVRADGLGLDALDGLTIRSLAGEDALLARVEPGGELMPTDLFHEVEAEVAQVNPVLFIADTLADLHPANENDRAQARQFIGMMRGLAMRQGCAVVILAHPSLTGLSSGTGTSGSTAWSNSVRSRLYLERILSDGYEADQDARRLVVKKTNYARTGIEISLRWRGGVFVADKASTGLERMSDTAKAERVFLKLLREYTANGRHVSAQPGPTFAPAQFATNPAVEGVSKRALRAAMDALFAAKRIVVATHGSGAKARSHIAEATNV